MATWEDARRIAEIHVAAWKEAYRGMIPDQLLDGLDVSRREALWRHLAEDASAPVFVAVQEGQLVGFCHISPTRDKDSSGSAEITAIYLDPVYWRQGLGRQLCSAAAVFASEEGYERITLWVLVENLSARRFYEGIGFRVDGTAKTEVLAGIEVNEVRYGMELQAE